MDRADRRSMRGRSLHRQHVLEASVNDQNFDRESLQYHSSRSTITKPTRPAPPPPLPKRSKNNTISTFTNLRNANSPRSQNFDLNSSLNGPKVSYESTTLIEIKDDKNKKKPKLPPKPAYLQRSTASDGVTSDSSLKRSPKSSFDYDAKIFDSNTNTNSTILPQQNESNDLK